MREYVKRFNKAVIDIDEAVEQVIMTTFQVGLINPDLIFSLGKTPPTLMMNLLFKAQKWGRRTDGKGTDGQTKERRRCKVPQQKEGAQR